MNISHTGGEYQDQGVEWWDHCYELRWDGVIVPEAFVHPAKMSRGLLSRIFDELFKMGLLDKGDVVLDPFSGIGTTGIESAFRGCRAICVEVEPRFAQLAQRNFALYANDWLALRKPAPIAVCGDSRQLREIVAALPVDCIVASPAYGGTGRRSTAPSQNTDQRCGDSDGQLARMSVRSVDAVVASPPWGTNVVGHVGGSKWRSPTLFLAAKRGHGCSDEARLRQMERDSHKEYGTANGQMSRMSLGDVDAVVSSPPYISGGHHADQTGAWNSSGRGQRSAGSPTKNTAGYGKSAGQLGQVRGDEFWLSAKAVVDECYALLKIGGVAVWVVKDFVRRGKVEPFADDWRKLCEHAGFVTIKEARARLVREEHHADLFDGNRTVRIEHKSFFRRLSEKKGSPPIDWETVLFVKKVQDERQTTVSDRGEDQLRP